MRDITNDTNSSSLLKKEEVYIYIYIDRLVLNVCSCFILILIVMYYLVIDNQKLLILCSRTTIQFIILKISI